MARVILMNVNPPMLMTLRLEIQQMNTCTVFSVLRLTITGAARNVLLQFQPKCGRPGDGKQTWLPLQRKYHNNSRQRRRTLLRRVDNNIMKLDTDPDVFFVRNKSNTRRTWCFGRNSLNGVLGYNNT